jgi:aspartate/methionine/tyrosine aminotransferase
MDRKETYLSWYKDRMKAVLDPGNYSLMSSCVSEPWDLLMAQRAQMEEKRFHSRFMTSNAYGLPALIQRISTRYGIPENRILTTQGVTSALFLLSTTFARSHVVVEQPCYEPLWQSPAHCGATVDFFTRHPGGAIDMDDLDRVLKPDTRLVIISNLHNPSGCFLSPEKISGMLDHIRKTSPKALLVVDEIYRDFVPGPPQPACLQDDRIISISSLTKVYGLSVLRCGWIFADPGHIDILRPVQVLMSGIGSRYLEALSTIVFDHLDMYLDRARSITGDNRKILQEYLQPLFSSGRISGVIPEWGCVCFLKMKGIPDTRKLTDYLETEYGLYCVPGSFFGVPDHVRIGTGEISPERLKDALALFQQGLRFFRV